MTTMRCPECGTEGSGNFCAQCGAGLRREGRSCTACDAELAPGDRYCPACGEPVEERPRKPLSAYLPWILSGAALVMFAIAIALLVQDQAAPRAEGMPPTGSVPQAPSETSSASGPGAASGAMPSASELADMGPREAADRLFDRTMREWETGDPERAAFFADMARRAYDRVPDAGSDLDVRFHLGMLALVEGDTARARTAAAGILDEVPGHLLGLLLARRAAEDSAAAAGYLQTFRRVADTADLAARSEYAAHGSLIQSLMEDGSGGG